MFDNYSEEEKRKKTRVIETLEQEEGREYTLHALERLHQRGILPCVVENTIEQGERYKIDEDRKEDYDSTHLYVHRRSIDIAPAPHPRRSIGNRIIEIEDGERTFRNLVVFTREVEDKLEVRSAYPQDDSSLESLLEKNVEKENLEAKTSLKPYKDPHKVE